MIAADRGKRRPKPHTALRLDEVYLKIEWPNGPPLAGCRLEGEVLDVLLQSKRMKKAALKRMRRLLKRYAFAPSGWSSMICHHTAPRLETFRSNRGMSAGDGRTIALRIRISRRGGGSARCSGSRAPVQPSDFFPPTPPSTTPSTSSVISSQPGPTARFAPSRWTRGGRQSQRPNIPRPDGSSPLRGTPT